MRSLLAVRIEFDGVFCVWLALCMLTLPAAWLFSALSAAMIHELGHALAVYLSGGRVRSIRIGAAGAVMDTTPLGRWQELVCAAAGPAASLLLLTLSGILPKIAACALLQGLFNLIPVFPLDGGRVIKCLLGEKVGTAVQWIAAVVLLISAVSLSIGFRLGAAPLFLGLMVLMRAFLRKIPCNKKKVGVQ